MPLSPRCARPLSSHPNHRNPPVSDTMSSTEVDSCLHVAERVGLAAVASGSNFVLSPLSIRAALGLAAAGASGETLHQMLSFLGSPTVDHLNSASARLMASVRGDGDCDGRVVESAGPRLSFVNGVWVDRSLTLKPGFDDVAASVYGAVTKSVDFRQQVRQRSYLSLTSIIFVLSAKKKKNKWSLYEFKHYYIYIYMLNYSSQCYKSNFDSFICVGRLMK